jgi:hypothetical protein
MGYHDIDQSNRRQYDIWWRMEEVQAYYGRKGCGELDIVKQLLGYHCPDDEDEQQYRQDLAQIAYAFLGQAGRDRFLLASRDVDWGDDEPLKRSLRSVGDRARQKAFAALYSHNVVYDASADAFRVYDGRGRIFDRETQQGFNSLIDDGYVEIDYKYEYNQGVCYRVDTTRAGIEYKHASA